MSTALPDLRRDLLLHDIRTPLATISGFAQLLRRRAAKERLHLGDLLRGLESIEAAAARAEKLFDELAGLPAVDDVEHLSGRRSAVDLVALAVRMSTQLCGPGGQRISVLPAVPELVGWWDRGLLERVLSNLFSNALKYSPAERDVLVTVQCVDDCAVLRVSDQGVGIPPAEVGQVFEPGFRASNVLTRFPGAGIGLAGVHQIVSEHGGTITVESELGTGTTVTVCLPIRGGATIP
jgi:signal transduction histidine kinase